MPRFSPIPTDQAQGLTAEIFSGIQKAVGKIPNAYATIGTLAPRALQVMLSVDSVLADGPLSKPDQETIKLVTSELSGCDYCVAAHSLVGSIVGLKPETMRSIREGSPTGDVKRDALIHFVRNLIKHPGTISQREFDALTAVGYTGDQIVHIGLAMTAITFTNVFNRINDTVVDFPKPQ